jgi:glycosyltransferase involved in cell wall biosynthesis
VIEHGTTGFIVEGEEQALEAIKNIAKLNRRRIRREFEERFTAKRMATDYVKHYSALVNGHLVKTGGKCRRVAASVDAAPPSVGN